MTDTKMIRSELWGDEVPVECQSIERLRNYLDELGIEHVNASNEWYNEFADGQHSKCHTERCQWNSNGHVYSCIWGYIDSRLDDHESKMGVSYGYPNMIEIMTDDEDPYPAPIEEIFRLVDGMDTRSVNNVSSRDLYDILRRRKDLKVDAFGFDDFEYVAEQTCQRRGYNMKDFDKKVKEAWDNFDPYGEYVCEYQYEAAKNAIEEVFEDE